MKRAWIIFILLALSGCASTAPVVIKFDEEFHKAALEVATKRMEYISCDVGLIDGLGIASSASFPIQSGDGVRAILQNPAVSIALGEMKEIAIQQGKWKAEDYANCKVLGLGYRTAALGMIDFLKLFPQLAPYLAILGPK